MATREGNLEDLEGLDRFDALSQEIEDRFAHFHSLLETQRVSLLERVRKMRDLYQEHQELSQAIEELEGIRKATNEMLKANLSAKRKKNVLKEWEDEINELKQRKSKLETVCNLRLVVNNEYNECVKRIHLREIGTLDYSKRKEPLVMKGKVGKGDGEVLDAQGIVIDGREVFVTDYHKDVINIYTLEGDFIRHFGDRKLAGPHGICMGGEFLFTSSPYKSVIYKFTKNEFIKKTSLEGKNAIQLNRPTGLCAHNELLYVCDSRNNRIKVLTLELAFLKNFGDRKLKYPEDIKIFNHEIFVLTELDNTIHTFTTEHNYLRSIHFTGQQNKISHALFFTIDNKGNFIVSDFSAYCLKVFSPSGEYVESIGGGYLIQPCGVVTDDQKRIVVINRSDYKCFQVY